MNQEDKYVISRFFTLLASVALVGPTAAVAVDVSSKWSQPPIQVGELGGYPLYRGFDEMSIRDTGYLAADDWLCADDRPVSDIRWWGSYSDWVQMTPPADCPDAFWFGIYSDVPPGTDSVYSHPGDLIWEFTSRDFTGTFVGFDDLGGIESLFRYEVWLPTGAHFYQAGDNTIYWVSLAAIYDGGPPTSNEWGWLTRPFFYGDAATKSASTAPFWTPNTLQGEVWDQAFEINALVPEPNYIGFVVIASGLIGFARLTKRRM